MKPNLLWTRFFVGNIEVFRLLLFLYSKTGETKPSLDQIFCKEYRCSDYCYSYTAKLVKPNLLWTRFFVRNIEVFRLLLFLYSKTGETKPSLDQIFCKEYRCSDYCYSYTAKLVKTNVLWTRFFVRNIGVQITVILIQQNWWNQTFFGPDFL